MVKPRLFLKVPAAYREIVLNHYKGEWILHDVDHIPYSFAKVHAFEVEHGVRAVYAFRPKFTDYILRQGFRLKPEELCAHFDGDEAALGRFCSELNPAWINGHDAFNMKDEVLAQHAKDHGLRVLSPVGFSDYSCRGDLVQGFLNERAQAGAATKLFNFHLDYFWPIFHIL